jgi:hypothetical protein
MVGDRLEARGFGVQDLRLDGKDAGPETRNIDIIDISAEFYPPCARVLFDAGRGARLNNNDGTELLGEPTAQQRASHPPRADEKDG